MYVLKSLLFVKNELKTYIQIRDSKMKLIVFFDVNKMKTMLNNEGLTKYRSKIEKAISKPVQGKLFKLTSY